LLKTYYIPPRRHHQYANSYRVYLNKHTDDAVTRNVLYVFKNLHIDLAYINFKFTNSPQLETTKPVIVGIDRITEYKSDPVMSL